MHCSVGLTQLLNVGAWKTASESPEVLVSKCLFLSPALDNKSEPRDMEPQNLVLTRLSGDSHAQEASRILRMSDKASRDKTTLIQPFSAMAMQVTDIKDMIFISELWWCGKRCWNLGHKARKAVIWYDKLKGLAGMGLGRKQRAISKSPRSKVRIKVPVPTW